MQAYRLFLLQLCTTSKELLRGILEKLKKKKRHLRLDQPLLDVIPQFVLSIHAYSHVQMLQSSTPHLMSFGGSTEPKRMITFTPAVGSCGLRN